MIILRKAETSYQSVQCTFVKSAVASVIPLSLLQTSTWKSPEQPFTLKIRHFFETYSFSVRNTWRKRSIYKEDIHIFVIAAIASGGISVSVQNMTKLCQFTPLWKLKEDWCAWIMTNLPLQCRCHLVFSQRCVESGCSHSHGNVLAGFSASES